MLSIGIIEDDENLRTNIVDYISLQNAYFVSFSISSIQDIKVTPHPPKLLLLDIHLAGQNSLLQIHSIKELLPNCKIIVMTGEYKEEAILEAIRAGASSFINKPFDMKSLMQIIENTLANGYYLNPAGTTSLFHIIQSKYSLKSLSEKYGLTQKEISIVNLIMEGNSYLEIALKIGVSLANITHQIRNISIKFGVDSKRKLLAFLNQLN